MTIPETLHATGIRRLGSPKRGFRYRAVGGGLDRATRARIDALKIPPAWTDVAIHPSSRAAVQAIGKDAAGRWQYLYHAAHVARRERNKRDRLIRFLQVLPGMRRTVRRHLAQPGLGREKVMAAILTVLGTCFLRPGSEVYADENGSYGIATLQRRHVSVRGDVVRFDFRGKSGQRQTRELRDRRVAALIRALLKHRGEVFKFRSDDGTLFDVRTRHINAYIKEVMGEAFSAKDFRTWAANLLCACALARAVADDSPRDARARKRQVTAVIRAVAEHLGNTPAVCRASYVLDCVIDSYDRGRVIRKACDAPTSMMKGRSRTLEVSERALIDLLLSEAREEGAKVPSASSSRKMTSGRKKAGSRRSTGGRKSGSSRKAASRKSAGARKSTSRKKR